MTKRESSDGIPHVDGEYVFEDGHNYGRIHYSGEDSDVREGEKERGGRERKKRRRSGGRGEMKRQRVYDDK